MKVLLTGATGFIGSHVARALLAAGHEVHSVEGDLLSSDFRLPSTICDLCIHLAWYVEPGKYLESPLNRDWVHASLRFARAVKCQRFVAAGTCFEYTPSDEPLRESNATGPRTLYAQSKLELFNALQSLDKEVAWVRFFYLYGPQEDPRRLVPVVINALLRGEETKLVPGDRRRDYMHIEDVGSAVAAVAQSQLTGAVNIGSGVATTVREIGLNIGALLGKSELLKFGALPYSPTEPMHIVADNTKLRSTGWKPRFNLTDGLAQTIEWWRQAGLTR